MAVSVEHFLKYVDSLFINETENSIQEEQIEENEDYFKIFVLNKYFSNYYFHEPKSFLESILSSIDKNFDELTQKEKNSNLIDIYSCMRRRINNVYEDHDYGNLKITKKKLNEALDKKIENKYYKIYCSDFFQINILEIDEEENIISYHSQDRFNIYKYTIILLKKKDKYRLFQQQKNKYFNTLNDGFSQFIYGESNSINPIVIKKDRNFILGIEDLDITIKNYMIEVDEDNYTEENENINSFNEEGSETEIENTINEEPDKLIDNGTIFIKDVKEKIKETKNENNKIKISINLKKDKIQEIALDLGIDLKKEKNKDKTKAELCKEINMKL